MRQHKSGLTHCDFDTVDLDTYIGQVDGVDDVAIRPDLQDYDCRNNRLLQMTLEQDGFAEAVNAAVQKYGHDRIGVFLGTSTAGILQTELAYRRRESRGCTDSDHADRCSHRSCRRCHP